MHVEEFSATGAADLSGKGHIDTTSTTSPACYIGKGFRRLPIGYPMT